MNFKMIWNTIFPLIKNKYILALIIFLVLIIVFDDNNLIQRRKSIQQLNQLKRDKEYYIKNVKDDQQRMNELITKNENLEKFAREKYLMKRPDEDVFIIIDEED